MQQFTICTWLLEPIVSYFVVTVEAEQPSYQLCDFIHSVQSYPDFCVFMRSSDDYNHKHRARNTLHIYYRYNPPFPSSTPKAHTQIHTQLVTTYLKIWCFSLLSSRLCQERLSEQRTVLWTVLQILPATHAYRSAFKYPNIQQRWTVDNETKETFTIYHILPKQISLWTA